MIKKCISCNKEFKIYHSPQKFCSRKCHTIFQIQTAKRIGEYRNCLICKKEFYIEPSKIKQGKGKFCSRKCSDKSKNKRLKKRCRTCNKPIIVRRDRIFSKEGNFCSVKCKGIIHSKYMRIHHNTFYKGGKRKDYRGYIIIFDADKHKYIMEHRLIMEKHLKRKLNNNEFIHHKNGIKSDNRLSNLQLVLRKTHFGNVRCPHCLKEFLIK